MRFRKLRIAWSAVWTLACVLMVLLWARSYWRYDRVAKFERNQMATSLDSGSAIITFARLDYSKISPVPMEPYDWRWEGNQPITEDSPEITGPSFQWSRERVGSAVSFPHWFPAIEFAALAAILWIPWSNKFSLRTLLIATTLVAVVLGLVVWLR
jgi:hypothetical protein